MTNFESLNGTWDLYYFHEGKDHVPQNPNEVKNLSRNKIQACVPGNVELDMGRTGKLPEDIFFGKNVLQARQLEEYQWWYFRDFQSPDWITESQTEIVFEGIDCFGTVWVNGIKVGECANAMISHRFDITNVLAPRGGNNQIAVRLSSPIHSVKKMEMDANSWAPMGHYESLWARKPAHCYGWDIMPRILSAGLWREVRLEIKNATDFEDVFIDTRSVSENEAILECLINFRFNGDFEGYSVRVRGVCGESIFEKEVPLTFNQAGFEIRVHNPELWWPRGYGKANLYSMEATLLRRGEMVSIRRFFLGIRKIELDRTPLHTASTPGRFEFIVNGTPIFCRGTNWVPADALHSRDADRIPRILDLIKEMECNMVRCWGGNVYESHSFFDFCDREGILVWQDFAMACAFYPQDKSFLEMIGEEATWLVKEMRQHASIALWSGDNEVDEMLLWTGRGHFDPAQNKITRGVLPEVVNRWNPRRAYMASSPCLSSESMSFHEPSRSVPEQHLWGPRNYYKSDFYIQNTAIFASEIGYHGCPSVESIKQFISSGKQWPCLGNDEWHLHSTDPIPEYPMAQRVQLMVTQIRELFGEIPDGLDHFAKASQIVQAEAKKFFVEFFRQRKGATTGILWWNMMDGWPQMSDAIVDYYFKKKLAFWYLKRAHASFALIVHEPDKAGAGTSLDVSLVNDSREERTGEFRIGDADSGETYTAGKFVVGSNMRRVCSKITFQDERQRLLLTSWLVDGVKGCGHYLYGKPPFDYLQYRQKWLPKIAALDRTFSADAVGL